MKNVWCSDVDPLRPESRKSALRVYGMSTFDLPNGPVKKRIPAPEELMMLRDRREREPEVQWQLLKKSGWIDFNTQLSDELEGFYRFGKPLAAVWIESTYVEFDISRMIMLPGHNKLRRVKYIIPTTPRIQERAFEDPHNDPILYKCSNIMGFKTPTRADVRRMDSVVSPSPLERRRARWKFASQPSPSPEDNVEKLGE